MRGLRHYMVLVSALAMLAFGEVAPLNAARDLAPASSGERLELLVLEVKNCNICGLVRTHIQPAYERSPTARDAPLRYVDVTTLDETKLGLKGPIDTVPTIVLMRNGREVDRIAGYVGPELFFKVLTHMMQQAQD